MKKLLVSLMLFLASGSVFAHGYGHHGHGRYYHPNYGWVFPTIVGGVIGYEIARQNPPVVVQQPPVIIQQPPTVIQQSCTEWRETQYSDGTVIRERICR